MYSSDQLVLKQSKPLVLIPAYSLPPLFLLTSEILPRQIMINDSSSFFGLSTPPP